MLREIKMDWLRVEEGIFFVWVFSFLKTLVLSQSAGFFQQQQALVN